MDFLDNIFYWLDEIAFLFFPPLILHAFLYFPRRQISFRKHLPSTYLLYLPAGFLLLVHLFLHLSAFFRLDSTTISQIFSSALRLDLIHYLILTLLTLILLINDTLRTVNPLIKKQLKWITYGLILGHTPFSSLYVLPFLFKSVPSRAAELSVVFLAIIPFAFAYSLTSFRLLDIEVLLKKALTLISSYIVLTILYFFVSSQTQLFSENKLNVFILGIIAILLGGTLFSPLVKLFQSLIDRIFYKKSYQYRKTLLSISQELARERDLKKLSRSLVELISQALAIKDIALFLPQENKENILTVLESRGEMPSVGSTIVLEPVLLDYLKEKKSLSLLPSTDQKDIPINNQALTRKGIYHILPLFLEGRIIGALAMGKKSDKSFLNSEDWDLLYTISPSVALALENAYLYNQVQKRAFELEKLKDYSQNIIESLTVGVAVLDEKGIVTGWNRVMEQLFLISKNSAIGRRLSHLLGEKNFLSIFPPDTQHELRLLSEVSLEMPTGEKRIFDIAKTPLLDNKMNPYGTVIVFEDVTEKMSLQQQLLTSEKLASIGLLSAGVAHEINTPLTGISSYIQILQKKLNDSSYQPILQKIEKQTERVARIIKNLLNFARNPETSAFQPVNLKESLEEILSLIDYKLKKMNITLDLHLQPVPKIWAQQERLQQVFINIILNALDAMPQGGTLSIRLEEKNRQAVIGIKDTGTGIKPQHLPHIFDPFFTTKGLGKGTGLGLSISYAIVKEHGGQIQVESEVGQGTCFTIYLPLKPQNKNSLKSVIN
jgi:PAS domain S-box-containing protein